LLDLPIIRPDIEPLDELPSPRAAQRVVWALAIPTFEAQPRGRIAAPIGQCRLTSEERAHAERLRTRHEADDARDDRLNARQVLAVLGEVTIAVAEIILNVDHNESGGPWIDQLFECITDGDAVNDAHGSSRIRTIRAFQIQRKSSKGLPVWQVTCY